MARILAAVLCALTAVSLGATPVAADTNSAPKEKRVVVLVSGTAATTPFTTPTKACRTGFSAGNTWAYLRDYLTDRDYRVFTAPASVGGTKVKETTDEYAGPFSKCPEQLPSRMTINAVGAVDRSGSSLARFLRHLHEEYGVTDVDLVGHSLGGFIGRAGVREAELTDVPVRIRSFATIGSPWDGTYIAAPTDPADPLSACRGFAICEGFIGSLLSIPGIDMLVALLNPKNTAAWNANQKGFLQGIPVTLFAGTYFTLPGGPREMWPNDGIAQEDSGLAEGISTAVLPHRRCVTLPLTHSLFVSRGIGQPDNTSLTWNSEVGAKLAKSIDRAGRALKQDDRIGCP